MPGAFPAREFIGVTPTGGPPMRSVSIRWAFPNLMASPTRGPRTRGTTCGLADDAPRLPEASGFLAAPYDASDRHQHFLRLDRLRQMHLEPRHQRTGPILRTGERRECHGRS